MWCAAYSLLTTDGEYVFVLSLNWIFSTAHTFKYMYICSSEMWCAFGAKYIWLGLIRNLRDGINSLLPSDAITLHRSGSPFPNVMASCLMAPSHYLNHCWLHQWGQVTFVWGQFHKRHLFKSSLEITSLKFNSNHAGATALIDNSPLQSNKGGQRCYEHITI